MAYASNNNAVLIDGCKTLKDLSVLLDVTGDVGTTDGKGLELSTQLLSAGGRVVPGQ